MRDLSKTYQLETGGIGGSAEGGGGGSSRGSFLERKKLLRCTTFDVLVRTAPSPTFRSPYGGKNNNEH